MAHNGIIHGIRRISHSEESTFKECRRKWWLAWYRGLRFNYEVPTEKKNTGDRIHRALEPWYVPEGQPRVDPREALEGVIREDRDQLAAHLTASGADLADSKDWKKLVALNDLERIMVDGYMEWLAESGEDENLHIIASETYVEAPLYEAGDQCESEVRLVGKIDVRARRLTDGARTFIDHKTAAVVPSYDELARNTQMKRYHQLERLVATDDSERCGGALYNVIRRVKRTAAAKPPFYQRIEINHNSRTSEAFARQTRSVVETMLEVEEGLDHGLHHLDVAWPTPTRDCSWKCPFAAICTMFDDGSRVENLLEQHYIAGDPLHYYGELHVGQDGE